MPFLRSGQYKSNISTAHSLRTYLDADQGGQLFLLFCRSIKRASLTAFRKVAGLCQKGSMTLEAAFALPLFLFAVINILYAVNMIGTQSRINAALHQTGNQMAFAGYVYDRTVGGIIPESVAGVAMTHLYARGQILKYIGKSELEYSCVSGGAAGISLADSSVMEEGDIIDLRVTYRVRPLIGIMAFDGFTVSQRYYGKAWTGYDVTGSVSDTGREDPMVYITQTGTVYHIDRNCTYLNPSVEAVDAEAVDGMRNQAGGRYYPCGICGGGMAQGQVYITGQGSSYHSRINCSGLKRTIYTVPLSEVGGRGRCSKCG